MTTGQFYFGFAGRITRSQFWLRFFLPAIIVTCIIDCAVRKMAFPDSVMTIWSLLLWWPFAAVLAKRWHDRNKSGWWTLIGLIPVVGQLWVIIECGCLPARKGANRFGDSPAENGTVEQHARQASPETASGASPDEPSA